jgi:hypothetical protein
MWNRRQYAAIIAIASALFFSTAQAQDQPSTDVASPNAAQPVDASAAGKDPLLTAQATTPSALTEPAAQPAAAPAADPPPSALPTPPITGPLSGLPPATFDAGPFHKLAVNGILVGSGIWTGNYVPGDNSHQAALSNGQIFIQKADGWFQFYVQAGAYDLPSLGAPFLATDKTMSKLFGPVPVAFAKLQPGKNTSIQIGQLPTLIGAEYTFTFENMNIDRGLLWNQEPAIHRGIQINQTMGKFAASLSWNDGFYSNRYSWLTGLLSYTRGPHALAFAAGGNYGKTAFQTFATPLQNNSSIYNVIYTYLKGPWIIQPYIQYTNVPANASIGVLKSTSTTGGAILASYAFKRGFSLPVRYEYIASSGTVADQSANLLYGPGSSAQSITVTPTYQHGGFFFRGDLAYVHASDITPGFAFSAAGTNKNQPRAAGEIGFIFGKNVTEK